IVTGVMSPGMGGHGAIAGTKGVGRVNISNLRPTTPLREIVPRAAQYLKPYRYRLLLILVCILASAVLNLLPPLLIRTIIDDAVPNRNVQLLVLAAVGSVVVDLTA